MIEKSFHPKLVFILDENELDVNTVKNRLRKENRKFSVLKTIYAYVDD